MSPSRRSSDPRKHAVRRGTFRALAVDAVISLPERDISSLARGTTDPLRASGERSSLEYLAAGMATHSRTPIALSPDGKWLALVAKTLARFELRVRQIDTGREEIVDADDAPPLALAWSPNGAMIAFLSCHGGDGVFH